MDAPDFKAPQHYINRELSFLEFNQRVLAQAFDESIPLLERLRFLCISSSNLDEFFEIRVAGLKQLHELGSAQFATESLTIPEQLTEIHARALRLVGEQYRCLNEVLLPALEKEGISLLGRKAWSPEAAAWLEQYFEREVEPVLSPLGLDPARPFPRIQNKSLNFIVRLRGKDAFGRDSELAVDEEEIDDLRRALEGELAHRRYGAAVRLETSRDCPDDMVQFLLRQFALHEVDAYRMPGPVNLNRLSAVYDLVQRPDL